MVIATKAYRALESIVGSDYISDDPVTCRAYAPKGLETDMGYGMICTTPVCVILPQNTLQIRSIVKVCNRYHIPYVPASTFFLGARSFPKESGVLQIDLKRMTKLEIDEKHMYAIVEPGVICSQLQEKAMEFGLYTMVPGGGGQVSVVANLLNHGWSPLNYRTGLVYRRILSVEWVLPDGELLKLGSLSVNDGDFFWGDNIGPDLRGILRGQTGWAGGMGIITRMAVKLLPFQPAKLKPVGISPDTALELPSDRMKWYNIELHTSHDLMRLMYELGKSEIGAAATKVPLLWRYIARAHSKEDFWEKWSQVTSDEVENTHILRVLLIGYTSEQQLQYEERVLIDVANDLGGRIRLTKPTDESWFKNADAAGMWWIGGSFMSVEFDIETIQHGIKQGQTLARLKRKFVPPLVDDHGDPGWFQSVEIGHCDYSEFITYWDSLDKSRNKVDHWYLEAAKENIKKGFYSSFLSGEQPIWLTGPAYGPNYHIWLLKVKKVFDPQKLSNPPVPEDHDEFIERAEWMRRDWERDNRP